MQKMQKNAKKVQKKYVKNTDSVKTQFDIVKNTILALARKPGNSKGPKAFSNFLVALGQNSRGCVLSPQHDND